MRDTQFKELVNLYLDNEITEEQLRELSWELKTVPTRRRKFKSYYRLHQASCTVLSHSKDRIHIRPHKKRGIWNLSFAAQFAIGTACVLISFSIFIPSLSRNSPLLEEIPPVYPIHASRSSEIEESVVRQLEPSNLKAAIPADSELLVLHSDLAVTIGNREPINPFFEKMPVKVNKNLSFKHGFKINYPSVLQEKQQKKYRSSIFETKRTPEYNSKRARFPVQR